MAQPTITPAQRIRELSDINADVPAMLASAGNAMGALTNKPLASTGAFDTQMNGDHENAKPTSAARKAAFTEHSTAYFTHLQSIMARLRRQAYALEEAGIVAPEAATLSTTGAASEPGQRQAPSQAPGFARRGPPGLGATGMPLRQPAEEAERITNGGLGNLDVGLLNSRANHVGVEKEAELIAEAKEMLENMIKERNQNAT